MEKYFNFDNIPDTVNVVITSKGYGKTYYEMKKLASENKKLNNIINKAIKHIETHQLCYQSKYEEISDFDNHLLDILKGSDNNGSKR